MRSLILAVFCAALALAAPATLLLAPEITGKHRRSENGYLAAWEAGGANAMLLNASGATVWSHALDLPGAASTGIISAMAWPDGSSAFGGGATSADGVMEGFIAIVKPNGDIDRIVKTTPFVAWHLRPDSSGGFWAFGRVQTPAGVTTEPAHNMLRHFARDGRQTAAMLPRGKGWPHPAVGAELLSLANGRIGILNHSASEWLEVDPASGQIARRTAIHAPSGYRLRGAAPGEGARVYVTGTRSGIIDTASGTWTDANFPAPIIGHTAGTLILSGGSDQVLSVPKP